MVFLGQGLSTIEDRKNIIDNTFEEMPNTLPKMIATKNVAPKVSKNKIEWDEDNCLYYDEIVEGFLYDNILYYRTNDGTMEESWCVALYVIELKYEIEYEQVNVGNILQMVIDIMDINNQPEDILELNEYLENKGVEDVIKRMLKVYCIDVL